MLCVVVRVWVVMVEVWLETAQGKQLAVEGILNKEEEDPLVLPLVLPQWAEVVGEKVFEGVDSVG